MIGLGIAADGLARNFTPAGVNGIILANVVVLVTMLYWLLVVKSSGATNNTGSLVLWIAVGIQVTLGGRRLAHLHRIYPITDSSPPGIAGVIPACNEDGNIEHALESVLATYYPDIQLTDVNDRPMDETGAIFYRV